MAAPEAHAQAVQGAGQGATPISAAPAPAKAPAKAAKTVDTVTVTGASQSGYRSSIDRRSYGVASD